MKQNTILKSVTLAVATAATMMSFSVNAATALGAAKFKEYTPTNNAQEMSVRANSSYNLTMGYMGWTHHSNWGYMTLKKGKPVTITVEAANITGETKLAGFHPGITVWYRPLKKGDAEVGYVNAHSYSQFQSIFEPKAIFDDNKAAPIEIGKIDMVYVGNAYDRDGMGDLLPEAYDRSGIYKELDGVPGKVSFTFTPQYAGTYQFVVGGINPDKEKLNDPEINKWHTITTTVNFPK